jgi:hypothetical protein
MKMPFPDSVLWRNWASVKVLNTSMPGWLSEAISMMFMVLFFFPVARGAHSFVCL